MKAREFLARKLGEHGFELRNLIKEPLGADEIETLARKVGGVAGLVAPKRRKEAEGMSDQKLVAWLAADGSRMRRPIVVVGRRATVGFTASVQEELSTVLS